MPHNEKNAKKTLIIKMFPNKLIFQIAKDFKLLVLKALKNFNY